MVNSRSPFYSKHVIDVETFSFAEARSRRRKALRCACRRKADVFLELKRTIRLPQVSLVAEGSERFDSSSARAMKRCPSPRCASAIQIVRPLESMAENGRDPAPTPTGFAEIVGDDPFPTDELTLSRRSAIECQPSGARARARARRARARRRGGGASRARRRARRRARARGADCRRRTARLRRRRGWRVNGAAATATAPRARVARARARAVCSRRFV